MGQYSDPTLAEAEKREVVINGGLLSVSGPTRLAADVHGRRHLGQVEVVRAMGAAEA